jgi:F-box protein 11
MDPGRLSRLPSRVTDTSGFAAVLEMQPRERLRDIVRAYGRDIHLDARRTEALLKDLCPHNKREVFALMSALRERVPSDLAGSKDTVPREVLLARLTRRMAEDLGLAEGIARWAVESWAVALDVVAADALPSSPSLPDRRVSPPMPVSPVIGHGPVSSSVSPPLMRAPESLPPLLVSLTGGGHSTTIADALRMAQAGQSIYVSPGTYTESLFLRLPVTIIGRGGPGQVVVESAGLPAVVMQAPAATLRGLDLRHLGGADGRPGHAVDVLGGELVLEDCQISSSASVPWSAAVFVHGQLAAPVVRRCRIAGAAGIGILVSEQARGVFEECEIVAAGGANREPGVMTMLGAAPVFRGCRIADGAGPGIIAGDRGQGLFESCTIEGNGGAGVQIALRGHPTLRACRIRAGKGNGAWITDSGRGLFDGCEIDGNAYAAVAITRGGNPTLRRCRIHDGRHTGIFAAEAGLGMVEDCEVFNNAMAGVQITGAAGPVVRRTRIRDHEGHAGVLVWEGGQGVIEDCEITGNGQAGVEIWRGGSPTMRRCTITGNGREGVSVHDLGAGAVEGCRLNANRGGAWRIDPGCAVRRAGNSE